MERARNTLAKGNFMGVPAILQQVMAHREAKSLVLHFEIPGSPDIFTCYPKDETSKARWLRNALKGGWKQVDRPCAS